MATILNEDFTSIGTKLADKIKSTFQSKQHPPSTNLPSKLIKQLDLIKSVPSS